MFSKKSMVLLVAALLALPQQHILAEFITDVQNISEGDSSSTSKSCTVVEKGNTTDSNKVRYPVDFYYEVHSKTKPLDYLPAVEAAIFSSISNIFFLCYGGPIERMYEASSIPSNISKLRNGYNRRRRRELTNGEKENQRWLTEETRRLGLTSISSKPDDELVDTSPCSDNSGGFCSIIHGQMTITALGKDDVSSIIDTMLVKIQREMNSGDLLDPILYPEITRITYGYFLTKGNRGSPKGSAKSDENPTTRDREYPLFYASSEKTKKSSGASRMSSFLGLFFTWLLCFDFEWLSKN